MKLILCTKCFDVFKLAHVVRSCACGNCSGKYLDGVNAEFSGNTAIPLGFANFPLAKAIKNQPEEGRGEKFTAFVRPKICPTMVKLDKV